VAYNEVCDVRTYQKAKGATVQTAAAFFTSSEFVSGVGMMIPINDRYRISSDRYQWMIQEARTRKGEKVWESKWFFGTFPAAVKGLWELMVRESDAQTLVDALADAEKITTTLSQALTPQFEVTQGEIQK